MKIRTQLIIIITVIVVVLMGIITSVAILTIRNKGLDDIEKYRAEELRKVKQNLINLVYMTYDIASKNDQTAHDKKFLEKNYGQRLKDAINIAEVILREKAQMVSEGKISLDEGKRQAVETIKTARYNNGTGYFWINDTTLPYPRMIMHATIPELDGKVLDDPKFNCALGKMQNLFQAFAEVCLSEGEGFIDYLWPKPIPGGLSAQAPKLSYVRLFKEWDLIIGTGIYIDDAVEEAKEDTKAELRKLRFDNGMGYFWINNTTLPYPRMIMHPTLSELDGKVLDNPGYNTAMGKGQNLFQAMAEACNKKGEGFVDYLWPKPTKDGLTKPVPKMSFVRSYKPWGWIIGAGVYIDNIEENIAAKTLSMNTQINGIIERFTLISVIVLLVGIGISILFARHLAIPIGRLTDSIRMIKAQGIYSGESPVAGTVETKRLGTIFNSMLAELRSADTTNKRLLNELEKHNRTLEQKVAERTRELETTLGEVKAANEKIIKSIQYAKMIQGSLLPDRKTIISHLPNSLFIWMPKDIVGGDLYFTEILEDEYIVAIVDCTGHGVPGAFMTMLASSGLKKIINEDRCYNPGEILKRLNITVKSLLLKGSEHQLFDVGMDAAVCLVKPQEGILEFSGARLPLYYTYDGKVEVIKGDRQSIGYRDSLSDYNFTTVTVEMSGNRSFYLSTDGFPDQIGGSRGFPFGNRRFLNLLQEINKSPFSMQREILLKTFNEHIGNNERLDDVTIVGFSI